LPAKTIGNGFSRDFPKLLAKCKTTSCPKPRITLTIPLPSRTSDEQEAKRQRSASGQDFLASGIGVASPQDVDPRSLDTLAWGRHFLPDHFRRAPSQMHIWLGEQLDGFHAERGQKVNVIGPRGGAKSTIATLCYALRAAVEGREPYLWIVSDTKNQAQTHLENIKSELEENPLLAREYPLATGRGTCWRATTIQLRNGTVRPAATRASSS